MYLSKNLSTLALYDRLASSRTICPKAKSKLFISFGLVHMRDPWLISFI